MKIDRDKLNTLLRSGLHPTINTRKKLAAEMGLDPTSITRWFAVRDRLGNPRFPVIPDRHVARILEIFNAQPQWLSLDNDAFRQQCFESAVELTKNAELSEQEKALRLKRIEQRRLDIDDYLLDERNWLSWKFGLLVLLGVGIVFTIIYAQSTDSIGDASQDAITPWTATKHYHSSAYDLIEEEKCWQGFSDTIGDYDEPDPADPCHYAKLMNRALVQLQAENSKVSSTAMNDYESLNAQHDYLLFLSEKLDQRRLKQQIVLNLELSKSEIRRNNLNEAKKYLKLAFNAKNQLKHLSPILAQELADLSTALADK
ncbi:hypothetical protein [Thalassotalea fusca]